MSKAPRLPDLERAIVDRLHRSIAPVSPMEMRAWLKERFQCPSRDARNAITSLINANQMSYRERHGRVVLEPSFSRPVRMSKRIIVSPPCFQEVPNPDDVVVLMTDGAAFGIGQHPTTRLCLEAIDRTVPQLCRRFRSEETAVLDIGTGSGILGIAALRLGIAVGTGIDIDPCALSEAQQHARLNGLAGRFRVADTPLPELTGRFSLTIANLRPPTLRHMLPEIKRLCAVSGALVLSGFRPEEFASLEASCLPEFMLSWRKTDKNWMATIFIRVDRGMNRE